MLYRYVHILIAALITSASLYSTSIFASDFYHFVKADIYCANEQTEQNDSAEKSKEKKKTDQAGDEEPECD